jgi:acetyl esterase
MRDASELSPALFSPAAIDPETAAFNERLEATLLPAPRPYTLSPRVIREGREEGKGLFGPIVRSVRAIERTAPGPAGEVPLRVFVPEKARAVYLYLHGGGHTVGRAHHHDPLLERTAREAEVAVVSVDYRLAPEDPFPAGPDDCEAVALWLMQHARAEFGTDRLLIGGASAGAHLSVLTLLRLRDRHGFTGFSGANLEYGVYDLSLTPSARRWGERYLILSTPTIEWFCDQFVPPSRRRDPDVSPLYADLAGLPPALFSVGTLDPLLDDTLFMSARWRAAGNAGELLVYPGGVHAFNFFPLQLAERMNARVIAFLIQHSTESTPEEGGSR